MPNFISSSRENPLTIARAISAIAHEGQLRSSGLPYFTHPESVAMKMDTTYEKVLAELHDVVENTVSRKFGKHPSFEQEEQLVSQILRIIAQQFKRKGYGLHDDIGGFTVADMLDDLDAITFRRHWVKEFEDKPENKLATHEEAKGQAYIYGINKLIDHARRTGRWQVLKVKLGDTEDNMGDNPKPVRLALYNVSHPLIEKAMAEIKAGHDHNRAIENMRGDGGERHRDSPHPVIRAHHRTRRPNIMLASRVIRNASGD